MIYYAVISFLVGIIFQKYFNPDLYFLLFLGLLFFVSLFFVIVYKRNLTKNLFIISILFFVGLLRMFFAAATVDPYFYNSVGKEVSFGSNIVEERDERDDSYRYVVQPDHSESRVLVVSSRSAKFDYGDRVNISGKLSLPKNFTTDTGLEFDYVSYLAKDKIHFILYQPKITLEKSGNSFFKKIFSIKNFLVANIKEVVPEPNASLAAGLLFGAKQSLGTELLDKFRDVGLIHIVVLSGYNITIVASALLYLASYLGRRNLGFFVGAVFVILFGVMVGLGATVIRSIIMSLIALLAKYLGRPESALRSLFVAAFLMILWNPPILFDDPSFQLSFLATLGLIVFSPFVSNFILNSKLKNIFVEKFGIREIVSTTFSVQIFLLPMLLYLSGQVSIISFFVNPLVLPIIPVVMFFGFTTSVVGIFSTILSWPFGILSYILTEIIIKVVEHSSSLTFATLKVGVFPYYVAILCYFGFGFLFHRLNKNTQ